MSITYRPDIDGLRALAVVPVVLFHADPALLSGGYIGVDIFFVISGFLITGIILDDEARGRFSILGFYERRLRRIFPALLLVMAASCAAAGWLMMPAELAAFGRSLVAAVAFVSNYHFMGAISYFAAPAETKPLLHFWSLAVEEQFYLFFPPLVLALARWLPRHVGQALVLAWLLSLSYGVYLMVQSPDAAFYSTPARTWELLTGSVIAVARHDRQTALAQRLAPWLAGVGLLAVGACLLTYSRSTPFPGLAALPPVVGSGLIIAFGDAPGSPVARLLGAAPLRWIGGLSYSLYLWHWPVLVFARMAVIEPLGTGQLALLLLALLALSWLSWRYVEVPFRKRHWLASRRPLFAAGGGAMLAMLVCGVLAAKTDGLPGRLPPQLLATLAAADDLRDTARDCVTAPAGTSIAGAQLCVLGGAAEVPVTFFVWGDSHAEALLPAIEAAAVQADAPRRGLYVVRGGCVPLVGVDQVRQGYTDCSVTTESTLRFLEQRPDIGQVVLVSRWALYAMGVRYRSERGSTVFIRDAQTQSTSLTENQRVFVRGLQRTVDRLRAAGKQVLLVTQVPETEWPVPLTLARADWIGRQVDLRPRIDDYRARQQVVTTQFEALQRAGSVRLVQPHTALCDAQYCAVRSDGQPRYADTNHLTRRSASALRGLFEDGLVAGNAAPPKARQPLRR